MAWLVTGAAGYIGSHLMRQHGNWVAVDDLTTGDRSAVPATTAFHHVDITDSSALDAVFSQHHIEGVVHLAALKRVADSVSNPSEYERVNVGGMQNLLRAMTEHDVRALVFASSAAVYGPLDAAAGARIDESADLHPANPYGDTKLAGEKLVAQFATDTNSSCITLRCFNAAGTSLGPANAGGLVELAAQAALSAKPLSVFGTDYPTADGTCVRDYVHVDDIVEAITLAISHATAAIGTRLTANIGTGVPASVLDVVHAVERASGRPVAIDPQGRRQGDVAVAVADVSTARQALGWKAARSLDAIAESTWKAISAGV